MATTTGSPATSLRDNTSLGTMTDAVTDPLPTGARIPTMTMIVKRPVVSHCDTVMITTDARTSDSALAAVPRTVNRESPGGILAMKLIQALVAPSLRWLMESALPLNSW